MYKTVAGSLGTRRSFAVTCGLAAGYGAAAKIHQASEAVEASLSWMKARAAAGLPFLTGSVTTGQVVYAWPNGPGQAGGGFEPVARFEGEVSPLYNAAMTDEEAIEILNNLASHLGTAFGQTRVYVVYCGKIWVLQAEEAATPTGETV